MEHSLDGAANRLRTNSRLAAIAGDLIENAIPINALKNKSSTADGTYAMAVLANNGDKNVVAIITVEMRTNEVLSLEYDEIAHSISGRLIKNESSLLATRALGNLNEAPYATALDVSIANLLEIVNSTHQSILSDSVLRELGQIRSPSGYYSERVKFSAKEMSDADFFETKEGKALLEEQGIKAKEPFRIPTKEEADILEAKRAEREAKREEERIKQRDAIMKKFVETSPANRKAAEERAKRKAEKAERLADSKLPAMERKYPTNEIAPKRIADQTEAQHKAIRDAERGWKTPNHSILSVAKDLKKFQKCVAFQTFQKIHGNYNPSE